MNRPRMTNTTTFKIVKGDGKLVQQREHTRERGNLKFKLTNGILQLVDLNAVIHTMKLAYNSNMDLHTLDPIDAKTLNEFVDEES